MIGKSLGHYELIELLGKGGMGEVYRARDGKLGRDVALKLLPDDVSRDPERLARLEREAQVLASLNHPNVAALYGLDEAEGRVFLTMELADGEDLGKRLARGALPVDEALACAAQIADGLEAAHGKGIVHRDLKPANVIVSEDGRVKLLDFGLARAQQADAASGDPMTSPTITAAMTRAGVILGSAAYMSPEQARGKPVDRQTDIWAFGVLLFEMLTAQRLFDGETITDSIAAILHRDVDWSLLPTDTRPSVRRLLHRCIERNKAFRLRDIGDARLELHDASGSDEIAAGEAPSDTAGRRPRLMPWIVALLAVAVAAAALLTRPGGERGLPLRKLTVVPITDTAVLHRGTLSPDGSRVAYRVEGTLWIRDLDQTTPRRVSTTTDLTFSWVYFWSPDSRWIAFVSDDRLWKAPMDGSAPTAICEIAPQDRFLAGAWGAGNRIFLAQWRGGLLEVSANGGTIRKVMQAPDDLVDYHTLSLLPDGATLLASAHLLGDSRRIDVIREGAILKSLAVEGISYEAVYSPPGHIVFSRQGGGVWAVPFALDRREATGEPFVIDPDGDYPSASLDGSLVYSKNVVHTPTRLVRVDLTGKVIDAIGEAGVDIRAPLLSPSGSVIAYTAEDKGDQKLWTRDLVTGAVRPVTQFKENLACSWTADGKQLLVARRHPTDWASPENGLYLADIGGGTPTRISDGYWGQLLPGGSGVLYWRLGIRNDDRLEWKIFGEDAPPTLLVASMQAMMPAVSPDGHVVAFESSDSGTFEIWCARFPGGENIIQLTDGGGADPRWSQDGRNLYYRHSGSLYRIPVIDGEAVRFGAPERLFDGAPDKLALSRRFDVLPDGSGFVVVQRLPLEDAAIIHVQNWASEFRDRP